MTTAFREAAGAELLAALDAEPDVVYALDAGLTLQFLNLAWTRHARENGGEQCVDSYGLGSSVRGVIPDVLRRFYEEAFTSVLFGGPPLDHEYRCPTPREQRLFRMRVARLSAGGEVDRVAQTPAFLIVSNQLVHVHSGAPREGCISERARDYVGADGIIVQCAHCRRCRRADRDAADATWDWVPAFVATPPGLVSHGLCSTCFAHHYPLE